MRKTELRSGEATGTGRSAAAARSPERRPGRFKGGAVAPLAGAILALWACSVAGQEFHATPEQREACLPDALNLCDAYIPDAARVKECLAGHLDELSPACRQVFALKEKSEVR